MLAPDAKIIDIAYAPAVNETSNASAVTVELSEINKASLSIGDISCVKLDGNGKISFIVLNNVTMQGYKFGIITKYTKLSGSSTYHHEYRRNRKHITFLLYQTTARVSPLWHASRTTSF